MRRSSGNGFSNARSGRTISLHIHCRFKRDPKILSRLLLPTMGSTGLVNISSRDVELPSGMECYNRLVVHHQVCNPR